VMTLGDLPEDDLLEYLVPPETDAGTRRGQAVAGVGQVCKWAETQLNQNRRR
jgi:hypothetical protein